MMQFETPVPSDDLPGLSLPWFSGGQVVQMVTALLLAVLGLAVLAFVVRPILNKVMAPALPAPDAPGLPSPSQADARWADAPRELPAPTRDGLGSTPALAAFDASGLPDLSDLSNLPAIHDPMESDVAVSDDPVDRLRQLIADRREETIEVLRGWMDDAPEKAR